MGVLYKGSPAWSSGQMIKHCLGSWVGGALLVAALSFIAGQSLLPGFVPVLAILLVILFALAWAPLWRRSQVYTVTDRGVGIESGFLIKTNQRELSFRRIQVVDVHQSIIEKLITKTGTVSVGSAAGEDSQDQVVFSGIKHPARVAALIREGEYGGSSNDSYGRPDFSAPPAYQRDAPSPVAGPAPWDRGTDSSRAPWDQDPQPPSAPPSGPPAPPRF